MADCPFKRQCEVEASFWQRKAAGFYALARDCCDYGFPYQKADDLQEQAAAAARRAMINLFAII